MDILQGEFGRTIYGQQSYTNEQYVLKIRNQNLIDYLYNLGYSRRNDDERYLSKCADRDFIKAYIEIHSSINWQIVYTNTTERIKYHIVRMRIYGNKELINELNILMHNIIGTSIKKTTKSN